jgi:hypothetical protein
MALPESNTKAPIKFDLYLKNRINIAIFRIGAALVAGGCSIAITILQPPAAAQAEFPSGQVRLSESTRAVLQRLPFCSVAKEFGVPVGLLAGVYLFENQINRGPKDTVQDGVFSILLAFRDGEWWRAWASAAMALADSGQDARLLSNKWSIDVISTGLVFSVGPAQITPRTALLACDALGSETRICKGGVKEIIASLLDESNAVRMAALVLKYEFAMQKRLAKDDVSVDIATWATIYNVGGEYFRGRGPNGVGSNTNVFGRWVGEHFDALSHNVRCDCHDKLKCGR